MVIPRYTPNHLYIGYLTEGVIPFYFLSHRTISKAPIYKDLIKHHIAPYFNYHSNLTIFRRDAARCHTANSVLSILDDQRADSVIELEPFLDLYTIESVWVIFNKRIYKCISETHLYKGLEQVNRQEWETGNVFPVHRPGVQKS